MKILVLNSGSSSIKYQLFNMENEHVLMKGVVERIGIDGAFLEYENEDGEEFKVENEIPDHSKGIELVIDSLLDEENGVLDSMDEIAAVGHRVVHGGEKFAHSTLISDEVVDKMEEVSELAPLHNPPNLAGIKVCKEMMPETPQVGVFDTAFHQSMPEEAYMYAIPYEYYEKYGVRRYGFHGTSHKFVAKKAAELIDKDPKDVKVITCHLGNGASVAAVDGGESVDTSMGLTPLEGLVMGTRSGDIDPAIIPFLMKKEGLEADEVDNILNKKSGLLGVSGVSNDSRDVKEAAKNGNERAELARKLFNYRVKKYIGSYAAAMGGVDAIVFTAGIGENAKDVRKDVMEDMEFLGVEIDEKANDVRGETREISTKDSKVKVFTIPTNEELVIARDTEEIVNN
ncbi:MAG TPA: acetate kinase [Halanaerobiales bacterium]|nr:acetate kinase [Halanaerobiales bacterium]